MARDVVRDVDQPGDGKLADQHRLHRGDVVIAEAEIAGKRDDRSLPARHAAKNKFDPPVRSIAHRPAKRVEWDANEQSNTTNRARANDPPAGRRPRHYRRAPARGAVGGTARPLLAA